MADAWRETKEAERDKTESQGNSKYKPSKG